MAQLKKPIPIPALGLDLSGNPTSRPFGSASVCDNLRIMPGEPRWYRLRSGREPRLGLASQDIVQFMPARADSAGGGGKHLFQTYETGTNQIWELDMSTWTRTLVETCGPNVNNQYPVAYAVANEIVVYGNGYGEHNSVFNGGQLRSVPGLSYWRNGQTARFLGMFPTVTGALNFSAATVSGGLNNIPSPGVKLTFGLYHVPTGHLSNVAGYVVMGGMTGGNNELTLTGVDGITTAWHSTAERDEFRVVFYSTLVGGSVPYLILNAAGTAPLTATLGTTTVSLNLSGLSSIGYLLDFTRQAPTDHYPPRQMRSVWYAGSRMFGILRPEAPNEAANGSWVSPYNYALQTPYPFEYQTRLEELAGIVWSGAMGDRNLQYTGGDPIQIWKPTNFSPTQNGERPTAGHAAPNDTDSIVWTHARTYIVREQADNLMEWIAIADYGLPSGNIRTVKRTRYGVMWVNNMNQVCIVGRDLRAVVVSERYDAILRNKSISCAGYYFEPQNQIDRYQVYYTDNGVHKSVCHDFATAAWATSSISLFDHVLSATQVENASGQAYMLTASPAQDVSGPGGAGVAIYSIESQPDQSYRVPTRDRRLVDGSTGSPQIQTVDVPDGTLEYNWTDGGDMTLRKEMTAINVIGDCQYGTNINQNALSGEVFADYKEVIAGTGDMINAVPVSQQQSFINRYLFKLAVRLKHMFAFKLRLTLKAHRADIGDYYNDPWAEGSLANNFYGSIVRIELGTGDSDNRG